VSRRLIAVLGYSSGGHSLHEACAARLRRAEAEARAGDVVLLSGWSRRRGRPSEAELMAQAWRGPQVELLVGHDARTTFGNALEAARAAVARHVDELVLVTSSWHVPRAAMLVRAALRGVQIELLLAPAEGPVSTRVRVRELTCSAFAPAQAAVLRHRKP
jgi:uncharacterized SAM-binding protein YcdF (DUF218 family)